MTYPNSSRPLGRYLLSTVYTISALLITLLIAVELQSGPNEIYVFIRDELFTDLHRFLFVCGFPVAYVASFLACNFLLKMPRFDFFNRLIVTNFVVYGFFGLILVVSRIQLFSRTVVLLEFIVTTILLIVFHSLQRRLYPRHLGILSTIDINPFKAYPYLRVTAVDIGSPHIYKLDGVIADLHKEYDEKTSYFLADLAQKRIPVYNEKTLIETLWGRVPLAKLTAAEIETFIPPDFYSPIKRVTDIVLVLALSPALVTISIIIGIAIKLDSRGPILFQQPRTGRHGRSFNMLKFRSMYVIADGGGIRFAERNDKQVTRVGRFLRRLRLDELPQMWNALKGEMSLIGPRPEQLEFTTRFDQLIPFYGFRHTVRPGITGWAQVMYGYAASDDQTREKLEFDFFYIKHMSFWLDLVVFAKTIRTIIIGSGAR